MVIGYVEVGIIKKIPESLTSANVRNMQSTETAEQ